MKFLKKNNATVIINQGIEKTFALGIGALVTSVEDLEVDDKDEIINTKMLKQK